MFKVASNGENSRVGEACDGPYKKKTTVYIYKTVNLLLLIEIFNRDLYHLNCIFKIFLTNHQTRLE